MSLFIRNLAKNITKEELSNYFSNEVGPVKNAIIIHDRHGGPSKGFGFVTFATEADTEDCLKRAKSFELSGKPLRVERAESTKKPAKEEDVAKDDTAIAEEAASHIDWRKRRAEREKPSPQEEELRKRTIVLFNLPENFTEQQLRKRLKKRAGGVVSSITHEDKQTQIVYENAQAVSAAVKEINGRSWAGSTVFARRLKQIAQTTAAKTKCRLIVRNVGFHITDQVLFDKFSVHGPVAEAVLNKSPTGTSRGFGFVQFYCRHDAEKALESLNGSAELGPKGKNAKGIAVDFALTKDHYEALKAKKVKDGESETKEEEANGDDKDDQAEEDAKDDEDDKEEDEDHQNEAEDEDEDETENENKTEDDESEHDPVPAPISSTADLGVREGRTLFIRNLLFETVEDKLRERFKEFGPVRGVKIVRDIHGRSRGSGFVEFWSKESADKALADTDMFLEGRVVFANRAVDKNEAVSLKKVSDEDDEDDQKKAKKKFDKRHLYLANEGRVPQDQVPQSDKKKRQGEEEEKRTKLRNPLFFVSPTRLSVRNLNRKPGEAPDAKKLKKVMKEAAIIGIRKGVVRNDEGDRTLFDTKSNSVRVTKALVLHDMDDPKARPSGFGFVEFTNHAHALSALRVLNNNPEYANWAAGGEQAMKLPEDQRPRLIVSFAIENAAKVKQLQTRLEKSKAGKTASLKEKKGGAIEKSPKRKVPEEDKKRKSIASGDKERIAPGSKRVKNGEKVEDQKRKSKDISNSQFEQSKKKKKRKLAAASDELDKIVASRELFEVPGSNQQGSKKRWFEE